MFSITVKKFWVKRSKESEVRQIRKKGPKNKKQKVKKGRIIAWKEKKRGRKNCFRRKEK